MTDDPRTCTRCGEPHDRCAGHNRAGRPCRQQRQPGQRVCHLHGGRSPQAIAAADERLRLAEAQRALEAFGVPVVVDPHTALLQELHRTAGAVAWLGAQVQGLETEELVWGVTREKTGGDDHGTTRESKPNAWYVLWAAERKHLTEVAAACVKAGIEERRVRLAEDQGRLLASVVEQVLEGLNLSEEQRGLVPRVVPAAFRAIEASGSGVAS